MGLKYHPKAKTIYSKNMLQREESSSLSSFSFSPSSCICFLIFSAVLLPLFNTFLLLNLLYPFSRFRHTGSLVPKTQERESFPGLLADPLKGFAWPGSGHISMNVKCPEGCGSDGRGVGLDLKLQSRDDESQGLSNRKG